MTTTTKYQANQDIANEAAATWLQGHNWATAVNMGTVPGLASPRQTTQTTQVAGLLDRDATGNAVGHVTVIANTAAVWTRKAA